MHLIGKPETEFTGQVNIYFTLNTCILVDDTYIHTYIHTYMYIYMQYCMYVCMYIYIYLCIMCCCNNNNCCSVGITCMESVFTRTVGFLSSWYMFSTSRKTKRKQRDDRQTSKHTTSQILSTVINSCTHYTIIVNLADQNKLYFLIRMFYATLLLLSALLT